VLGVSPGSEGFIIDGGGVRVVVSAASTTGSTDGQTAHVHFDSDEAFLLFQLHKFDWSLKRNLLAPRKVYPADQGLSNTADGQIILFSIYNAK